MVYEGNKDLKFDKSLKTIRKETNTSIGSFIFDPDSFKEQARFFNLKTYQLTQEELIHYAKLASRLRTDLKTKSDIIRSDEDGVDISKLPVFDIKLSRGCKKEKSSFSEQRCLIETKD